MQCLRWEREFKMLLMKAALLLQIDPILQAKFMLTASISDKNLMANIR